MYLIDYDKKLERLEEHAREEVISSFIMLSILMAIFAVLFSTISIVNDFNGDILGGVHFSAKPAFVVDIKNNQLEVNQLEVNYWTPLIKGSL